jgi:hypothetical protein
MACGPHDRVVVHGGRGLEGVCGGEGVHVLSLEGGAFGWATVAAGERGEGGGDSAGCPGMSSACEGLGFGLEKEGVLWVDAPQSASVESGI